ncbi:serine--tRNA ligase [Mesomycoplasma conjunctivae]|uniref:serine--tRNA ligase n=1 Tax=Mesomycoplasma conjunctivae TaxID=45361 RepID=UPI003DA48D03
MDIRFILNNKELVKAKLATRNFDVSRIDNFCQQALLKNQIQKQFEELLAKRNKISAQIGQLTRQKVDTTLLKKEVEDIKVKLANIEQDFLAIEDKIKKEILEFPNLPLDEVPVGKDENDNLIIAKVGSPRLFDFPVVPHYDFGVNQDYLDFKRAVKLSGNRFVIYKNLAAKLVRVLINLMIDTHISRGYQEILPNTLILEKSLYGTGQLPKFSEDFYKIENSSHWLIPTAEVPITNYFQDEIIDLANAKKFVGYSKSYRSEAGSGGRDTKGIIRLHEFHKVELVKITNAEDGIFEFEQTVEDAAYILELLEIPYQKVVLSTGDLGFSARKTVDLEAWMPSENKYREVSSISYCGDFQAQRAKIRYRDQNGKVVYAHTINGSGLAIDRIVAILLEQYQEKDGTWRVPTILEKYFN